VKGNESQGFGNSKWENCYVMYVMDCLEFWESMVTNEC